MRTRFLTLAFTGGMLALIACDSSSSNLPDAKTSPDARDGAGAKDGPDVPDVPGVPDAGPDGTTVDGPSPIVDGSPIDAALPLDAPAVDVGSPVDSTTHLDVGAIVDIGTGSYDGGTADRYTFTIPDGRQLTMVDYCLPIRPLSNSRAACPMALDDAIAAAQMHPDAGRLPLWSCREGLIGYTPSGPSLGWTPACYYDVKTRELVSVTAGGDTLTECTSSPEPNTAAFTAEVYGRKVTCSSTNEALRLDAGSID